MITHDKLKILTMSFAVISFLGLSACKDDASQISPEIQAHLHEPCAGEITSSFAKTASGWTLIVTCADENSAANTSKEILKSAGGSVPFSSNADQLMSFE